VFRSKFARIRLVGSGASCFLATQLGNAIPRLKRRALLGLAQLTVAMALLVFLPAVTLRYPEGWIFLLVFCASSLAITLYLMKNDPKAPRARAVRAGAPPHVRGRARCLVAKAKLAGSNLVFLPT
jgi:hypothetical protein